MQDCVDGGAGDDDAGGGEDDGGGSRDGFDVPVVFIVSSYAFVCRGMSSLICVAVYLIRYALVGSSHCECSFAAIP